MKLKLERPIYATEMEEDDSVGSLEEFLEREGIKFERKALHSHESPERALVGGSTNFDDIDPKSYDMSDMQVTLLLPNCLKISDILQSQGFKAKASHNTT